jgi:glycosyltransferase involved in cell wall biosynthesis
MPARNHDKLRLLLLGATPPPFHGSSIYIQNLVEVLQTEPGLVLKHIETSDRRDDLDNMGRLDLINIVTALKAMVSLLWACMVFRPHVVYVPISQGPVAYFRDGLFILVGRIMGSRLLVHLHGAFFGEMYEKSSRFMRRFINFTLRRTDGAIVLGERLRSTFHRWLPEDRVYVLPNFVVPPKELSPQEKVVAGPVQVTYLGNLVVSKGVLDLLDAVERLTGKTKKAFVLTLAGKFGDDPYSGVSSADCRAKVEERIAKLGGVTKYMGPITNHSDKWNLLAETDIFVLPSWYEGQPLVILEALCAGCPVVSTRNVGVIDETVVDGKTGILVDRKNVGQLANAIQRLVENRELRLQMSEQARQRFLSAFTSDIHAQRFHKIVKTVADTESK